MEREQLISAYVWREMSAGERQAADELLRVDPQFKQQVQKFSEWSGWLKQGRLEVTAEMIQSLRKRIEERVTAETANALVAIHCSGEINSAEKVQLDREISKNPLLRATSERLEKFTQRLEAGKLEVSAKLEAKLRHNVQVAVAAKPRRVPKTQPKPTVRIYVTPEVSNPWTFRISAAAAVVALLAAGGIYVAIQNDTPSNVAATTTSGDSKTTHPNAPEVAHQVQPPNISPETIQPQPEITPEPFIAEGQPKIPAAVPNNNDKVLPTSPEKRVVVDNEPKPATPLTPEIPGAPVVPKRDKVADGNPLNAPVPNLSPAPQFPDRSSNGAVVAGPKSSNGSGGGAFPANPNVTANEGNTAPKPGPEVAGGKTTTPKTPKNPNPKDEQPAPEALFAIAEVVMGNTAGFTPEGGGLTSIRGGMQIPSGSEITSGQTHFSLLLPGGAELYINVNSALALRFERSGTATVVLKSGEIYYNGKGVKIEVANQGGIALTNGKAVDARLTPASVIFGIVKHNATIAANGKKASYGAPNAVVIPFNGQDPQGAALGNAIAWSTGLGADPTGKNIANEKGNGPDDAKNKSRNRNRKKN